MSSIPKSAKLYFSKIPTQQKPQRLLNFDEKFFMPPADKNKVKKFGIIAGKVYQSNLSFI